MAAIDLLQKLADSGYTGIFKVTSINYTVLYCANCNQCGPEHAFTFTSIITNLIDITCIFCSTRYSISRANKFYLAQPCIVYKI